MIFLHLWSICQRKKTLVLIVIYCVCTFLFISYIKSSIYPKKENCFLNEENSIKSMELISKIETNMNVFLKKHSKFRLYNKSDVWTEIAQDVFIYSAYIDKCPSTMSLSSYCVQFIGITLLNITDFDSSMSDLKCAFKRRSNIERLGLAFIEKLPEHHFKPYTAALFYCSLNRYTADLTSIDYATLYRFSVSTWLQTTYLVSDTSSDITVNLCVRPLYGLFSSIHLVEFLAYYKTMGVKHFIFYRHNVSESMDLFLNYLIFLNVSMEIRTWDVPLDNNLIHEYGQIVFTQDCIVRSRYKFSHTIIVDIDEFIVPKLHSNITALISYLDKNYENAGSYTIPMVLFCDEFSYDKSSSSLFHILDNNKRQRTPWAHRYRSKYIVRSARVFYGGIHFVWKHEKKWYEVKVSDSTALLHHYRHCCGLLQTWFFHLFNFHVLNDDIVIDDSLIKNAYKLVNDSLVLLILDLSNVISFDI